MRKIKLIWLVTLILTFIGCKNDNNDINIEENTLPSPNQENLIFYLPFDESRGSFVKDQVTENLAKINYVFNEATYQPSRDPKWVIESSVRESSLTFDGYSTKIEFDQTILNHVDDQLTIDVFVAPRMFEWSPPQNSEFLQVIVGSYHKEEKKGFVLGMHKYGHYSFQIGLGDRWVELWNEWNPLDRYAWNHLTATFNGYTGEMKLYKNGELINERNDVFGHMQLAEENILIAASNHPQKSGIFELNMFNGLMDELKIYNKSFTIEDVTYNHDIFKINGKINDIEFSEVWLDEDILANDIYLPEYHANPPQHWMNEPHALFYYNGYYHMFYQFNLTGPYWRQIVWGHWISEDLISWKNLKEAVIMNENSVIKDGVWSGSATFKDDGTPVLLITAGDDEKINLYSNQNMVIATPQNINDPYLLEWNVSPKLSVKLEPDMGKTNEFRDFSVYQEDGVSYMLATGAKFNGKGTAYLYSTNDDSFMNWTYHGHFFDPVYYPEFLGSSWELVHMAKLYNKNKTISKYVFILSPAGRNADNDIYYYLGNFNKETMKFEAEHDIPKKMDYGENVFTGPGIYYDALNDRVLITSITQDLRNDIQHYESGWAHNAGMPKEISLDDDGNLIVTPILEVRNYIQEAYLDISNQTKNDANYLLSELNISDQTIYMKIIMQNIDSSMMGVHFKKDNQGKESKIYYNFDLNEIIFDTTNSGSEGSLRYTKHAYTINDSYLIIEMIIDHSMVEIYINNEKTITASIYNSGTAFEVFSDANINILSLSINNFEGGN